VHPRALGEEEKVLVHARCQVDEGNEVCDEVRRGAFGDDHGVAFFDAREFVRVHTRSLRGLAVRRDRMLVEHGACTYRGGLQDQTGQPIQPSRVLSLTIESREST